jgi:nicotinate phosphoribosyltransferase
VLLQELGPASVGAYNAYAMCADLPKVAFLAMEARYCAGAEMAAMMAYAAAVGSAVAQREAGAIGFVGCAADATARFFGQARGLGTMPHALIGYAGSTVRAAELFHEVFPSDPITVLIDYFGHEISDAIAVAQRFPDLAPRASSRSASTLRAALIAKGSTPPAPTRCSKNTRRMRSAAIARRRNCVI